MVLCRRNRIYFTKRKIKKNELYIILFLVTNISFSQTWFYSNILEGSMKMLQEYWKVHQLASDDAEYTQNSRSVYMITVRCSLNLSALIFAVFMIQRWQSPRIHPIWWKQSSSVAKRRNRINSTVVKNVPPVMKKKLSCSNQARRNCYHPGFSLIPPKPIKR